MRGEAAVWFLVQDYASWLFTLARRIFNKCTQACWPGHGKRVYRGPERGGCSFGSNQGDPEVVCKPFSDTPEVPPSPSAFTSGGSFCLPISTRWSNDQTLALRVGKAKGLPRRDDGQLVSALVKARFCPSLDFVETRIACSGVWDEELTLEVPDMAVGPLEIQLCDREVVSRVGERYERTPKSKDREKLQKFFQ